ncbi:hypothetical protein FC84_GL000913 [Lapidilactobacillus dextrinicus DSM 20335]|uniref:Integrase catalytic domain-containing protein n=1 Tax=Lapidilactobacillus dextrinicus DSM 20335 TaxID=1423738 RepID=A0A0R2BGV7_9LACO|nr:hypothetical protein FC84_GL000913 [Lapidilactobacillus dextrinicus DSM 20335]QFG47270.1 IS3 family transposase [Lapidilactobacillus dextrinicus]
MTIFQLKRSTYYDERQRIANPSSKYDYIKKRINAIFNQSHQTYDHRRIKKYLDAEGIHSDQGWHYQTTDYQDKLKALNIVQSMSRKGNCLDNAPIESFFSLLKRKCLKRHKIHNLTELIHITHQYIDWFNNFRISLKTKGLTPVQYRNQTIVSQ